MDCDWMGLKHDHEIHEEFEIIIPQDRGGQSGGAGGAQATPGILIFQKQVTQVTKLGEILRHFKCKIITTTHRVD